MKKSLAFVSIIAVAASAALAQINCSISTYQWDLVAYDAGGDPVHNESEVYPSTSNLKVGYIYEYVPEAAGYVSEYFDSTILFDLSPLSGITSDRILSATIIGMSVTQSDREGGIVSPSFNHVLYGLPTEICATNEITASIDITSYLKSDIDAGNAYARFSMSAPDVAYNTEGVSYDKILMYSGGNYPIISVSVAPIPEPAHFAALFGLVGLALAAYRRRK